MCISYLPNKINPRNSDRVRLSIYLEIDHFFNVPFFQEAFSILTTMSIIIYMAQAAIELDIQYQEFPIFHYTKQNLVALVQISKRLCPDRG